MFINFNRFWFIDLMLFSISNLLCLKWFCLPKFVFLYHRDAQMQDEDVDMEMDGDDGQIT